MMLSRSCALALCTIGLFFSTACTQHEDYSDRVVVRVNTDEMTTRQFAEKLSERLKGFNALAAKDEAVINQAKAAVVQDFVVSVITNAWAKENNIFVRKEDLDTETTAIRKQYPDDLAFRKSLAEAGLSYKEWEDEIRHNILEKLVLREIRKTAKKPASNDIEAYYKEHKSDFLRPPQAHLRQIVLATEEQAKMVRKELNSGKSLASLARKFSIGAEREQDGDIGWINRGTHDIFDSAFRMGVGQKSQIIKSPFGFHIFQLLGRRSQRTLPLSEAKPQIERILLAKSEQEAYAKWLETELLKARVYKDDTLIAGIKVYTRSTE